MHVGLIVGLMNFLICIVCKSDEVSGLMAMRRV